MTSSYKGPARNIILQARVHLVRGRELSREEVLRREFLTPELEERHCFGDWHYEWYELEEEDCIELLTKDDKTGETEEWALGIAKPLIDPPQRPDHPYARMDFETWLRMNLKEA
jgi:hypothetical protein